jgi:hypothetical protein
VFEVEHILPISQQGPDEESNWALACRACNLHKADYLTGWDDLTQQEVKLFHPRFDRWEEHFRADPSTGQIHGITPVGRITVVKLRMNSALAVEARRLWIRLGLFP